MDILKDDHNERKFKRLIIGGILDQLERSFKTREASYKWSTIKHNSINTRSSQSILWNNSSIQMWSTSKDWKGCVIKTWPSEKFLWNNRSTLISSPQLKIKIQIMAYHWTFRVDPRNLEIFCEQSRIKYDIIDYGVTTMDLQKKSIIETGESGSYWLKIAF